MPDALITGATGFVGGAVLQRLASEGLDVRALIRRPDQEALVRTRGASSVALGDVADPKALTEAMEACRWVFHIAGVNETCMADPAPMYLANVDGSVNVVRAAAIAGIERVIYTSSLAVIGEKDGEVATEQTVHSGEYVTHYARSKHHAELAVFAEAGRLDVDVVAVNPTSVQGPGRTGGTAKILIGYLSGRLPFAVDTVLSLVSIGDTAEAHLLAAERGVAGERYLISGATVSVGDAVELLGRMSGIDRRVRFLPGWVVGVLATVVGGVMRLFGKHPPVCREMSRVLRRGSRCNGSRAERELGLVYTPVEEWLAETIEWYRSEGLI